MRGSTSYIAIAAAMLLGVEQTAFAQIKDVDKSEQENVSEELERAPDDVIVDIMHINLDAPHTLIDGTVVIPGNIGDVREHELADKAAELLRAGDYRDVLDLLKANPELAVVRPEVEIYRAWSLLQTGNPGSALSLFEKLYKNEKTPSFAVGLSYSARKSQRFSYLYKLAEKEGGPLADILQPGKPFKSSGNAEFDKMRQYFLVAWAFAAIEYDRMSALKKVKYLLNVDSPSFDHAGLLVNLGWLEFNNGSYQPAKRYFTRGHAAARTGSAQFHDARTGLIFVDARTGNREAAYDKANALAAKNSVLARLASDLAMEFGYENYQQEAFNRSHGNALDAERLHNANERRARLLQAWSLLGLKRFGDSAEIFKALYSEQQDLEAAQGLYAAYDALGKRAELSPIAARYGGPLADLDNKRSLPSNETVEKIESAKPDKGISAFYRNQFLLAAGLSPERYGHLSETGETWVGASVGYWDREGSVGLDDLAIRGLRTSVGWSSGNDRFRLDAEFLELTSGVLQSPTQIGSRPPVPAPSLPAFSDSESVFIPTLAWRREGEVETSLKIAPGPFGGVVGATILGEGNAKLHNAKGHVSLGIHRTLVSESILSMTGITDPWTGQDYGRVVETGLNTSFYHQINDRLSLSGSVRAGKRTGKNVADNSVLGMGASLSWDLKPEGYSYFVVGPAVRYESFAKNLSRFTFGHGGYYSPERSTWAGISSYFLTEQGRDWLLRGGAEFGYQNVVTKDQYDYPLEPFVGDLMTGRWDSSGAGIGGQFQYARLITDKVIAELGGYYTGEEKYTDYGIRLGLKFHMGERSGLYVTDLEPTLQR